MLNTEQQEDINNIYSDLLVLSTELDSIKKCLNSMAMALRPIVTNIPETYPWDDIAPHKPKIRNGIRKEKPNNVPQVDLGWDA